MTLRLVLLLASSAAVPPQPMLQHHEAVTIPVGATLLLEVPGADSWDLLVQVAPGFVATPAAVSELRDGSPPVRVSRAKGSILQLEGLEAGAGVLLVRRKALPPLLVPYRAAHLLQLGPGGELRLDLPGVERVEIQDRRVADATLHEPAPVTGSLPAGERRTIGVPAPGAKSVRVVDGAGILQAELARPGFVRLWGLSPGKASLLLELEGGRSLTVPIEVLKSSTPAKRPPNPRPPALAPGERVIDLGLGEELILDVPGIARIAI